MVNSLWFKWKSLRLPWRKSRLVGQDLSGNTFWEFKDALNAGRWRRIVKFHPKTHYSDVKVSPQWHQWLRYVRETPPSVAEQQQDIVRQVQMKELARLADERWASKPSFLDQPKAQQSNPTIDAASQNQSNIAHDSAANVSKVENMPSAPAARTRSAEPTPKKEENPWLKADARGPGEAWQPESWSPKSQR
ncbi:hypothetical protein N7468_010118 [Penicillium chermesinum]|uniref:NADH dehydrogenase [ubiquinone] 1 alpha subcomplex subunit n=1 Tax=Penicillium chermesinum TaxID=63820 RepID=A0A9W9NC19_9EURO|nr:uncharacterized protein N7468_010118 [Penicillium chermesinum]KAJ5217110.1 hypothetical protein N7468_010118 [Penicillium chermesinum]KAJ6171272.1 hypothetical protein N7470_000339 [Penicillium chermesinum]